MAELTDEQLKALRAWALDGVDGNDEDSFWLRLLDEHAKRGERIAELQAAYERELLRSTEQMTRAATAERERDAFEAESRLFLADRELAERERDVARADAVAALDAHDELLRGNDPGAVPRELRDRIEAYAAGQPVSVETLLEKAWHEGYGASARDERNGTASSCPYRGGAQPVSVGPSSDVRHLALCNVRALALRMSRKEETRELAEHLLRFCEQGGVTREGDVMREQPASVETDRGAPGLTPETVASLIREEGPIGYEWGFVLPAWKAVELIREYGRQQAARRKS